MLSHPKDAQSAALLDGLANNYIKEHKFKELINFLNKLQKNKAALGSLSPGYYIALCRFEELKYLEEIHHWQLYFDDGRSWRKEIYFQTENLVKENPASLQAIKAQTINWLTHKSENDDFTKGSLDKLKIMLQEYSSGPGADIGIIKETARIFKDEGEKQLAKAAYNIYINLLVKNDFPPADLKKNADEIFTEGNIELASLVYSRYIELVLGGIKKGASGLNESRQASLAQKQNIAGELALIARKFSGGAQEGRQDLNYANKVLKILKDLYGSDYIIGEDTQYLIASNLQRTKDYASSAWEYRRLVDNYQGSKYLDEAEFKLGFISVYVLNEYAKGIGYFKDVCARNVSFEYTVMSFYQLGLLSQYKGGFKEAEGFYAGILQLCLGKDGFKDLVAQANYRLKEIKESKPIEYNLRLFLDCVFFEQGPLPSAIAQADNSQKLFNKAVRFEVYASIHKAFTQEEVKFGFQPVYFPAGSICPKLTYLWSGDLGSVRPVPSEGEFTTDYKDMGLKIINLVVLDSVGVLGAAFDMVEVCAVNAN